ncbi:hypothetical protein TNCV_2310231 [Trichonephila clavipes]|nr:hypothetical protein TNCV_2310231 [Trichonephila clavipes]
MNVQELDRATQSSDLNIIESLWEKLERRQLPRLEIGDRAHQCTSTGMACNYYCKILTLESGPILGCVRTRHPFRWGKRRIHQIPFVVNNNRADVKTTVAILRDRRPPINTQSGRSVSSKR